MNCPSCHNSEFDPDRPCLACGFRLEELKAKTAAVGSAAPTLHVAATGIPSEADAEEVPEWRRELSRRLQRIREKKEKETDGLPSTAGTPDVRPQETGPGPVGTVEETAALPSPMPAPRAESTVSETIAMAPAAPVPEESDRRPEPRPPRPKARRQRAPAKGGAPEEPGAAVGESVPAPAGSDPLAIQSLIDTIVAGRLQAPEHPEYVQADPAAPHAPVRPQEDKLIILTRTLSGLVDLLIILMCGYSCVAAADIISGIETVDTGSYAVYGMLLMWIHIVYSVFFLGTVNQTIGMMMTDLRVAGEDGARPTLGRILLRSVLFLPSLLLVGIGLVFALWDKDSRCLHDRYSGTRVVRLIMWTAPQGH